MRKNKQKKKKLILLSLLLIVAVGYAAISTTLNINGFTSFKGKKWKIYWDDLNETEGSVEGSANITGEKKTSIVVNAEFETLGDYYEFTVDMVNDGDFNAEIDTITTNFYEVENETDTTIEKPDYINYSYTYDGGTQIKSGDFLAAGQRKTCKIRVGVVDEVDSVEDLPDDIDLKTIITINYKKSEEKPKTITLKKGVDINNIIYNLAYQAHKDDIGELYDKDSYEGDYHYENVYHIQYYINRIKMATKAQYDAVKDSLTNDNLISKTTIAPSNEMIQIATGAPMQADDEDADPVYVWYEYDNETSTGTIYYYTEAENIYLNEDSSKMFYGLNNVSVINTNKFVTDYVENMAYMFRSCKELHSLDLSNFDTSNVTNMSNMFCDIGTNLDLSNFDTSNVKNMSMMFFAYPGTNLNLSNFDTSNVTNMSSMFENSAGMKVLNISNFDTANVTNMNNMFYGCKELETIYASNKFVTTKVNLSENMFSEDEKLKGSYGTEYDEDYINKEYARLDSENNPGYFSEAGIYVIKYNPNGGVLNNQYSEITIGDSLGNLPTPTNDDNEFLGWYTAISGGEEVTSEYVPTGHTELYAKWKYEIKFNANEGTVNPTQIDAFSGEALGTLPIPTKEGYGFVGWYTELIGGVRVGQSTIPTGSVTYYAHWKPLKTVTYKSTDGLFNNNTDTNVVTYKYTEAGATKYSHTNNIDNSGVASGTYDSNLSVNDIVTIDGAESIKIDVWYSTESTSYDWLAIYPKGVIPTSSNYDEATISNGKLGNGRSSTKPINPDNHKTYIVNDDTAQFYFVSDSGSNYYGYYAIISDSASTGYHSINDYLEPVYGNKVFSWNTKADGTGTTYYSEEEIRADLDNLGNNVTLYARWRDLEEYTITFNANGGSVSEPTRTVTERDTIGPLPTPTNGDDLFVGWYTELSNGIYVDPTYIPTGNKTLYARWNNPSSFANDDWPTIIAAVKANKTSNYSVGDTKQVDLGELGTHTLRIANIDTPSACANSDYSQSACGFVVEFADIITNKYMNSSSDTSVNGSSNKGGWEYSYMRNYVNDTIYNSLPIGIRRGITNTRVVSSYGMYDSSNFTTTDKLYLLSIKEVYGSNVNNYDTAADLTHQLEYYNNTNVTSSNYSNAIKKYNTSNSNWWLRTAYGYGYFNIVSYYGRYDYYSNTNNYGVSPAFRIG